MGDGATVEPDAVMVDRGARLFEYLAQVQGIGSTRMSDLADSGSVTWLANLPGHHTVRYAPASDGPFLVVGKVQVEQPPAVDPRLAGLLAAADTEDPDREPTLRDRRHGAGGAQRAAHDPEIAALFDEWLARWRMWALRARPDVAAQQLYRHLYQCHVTLGVAAESQEAVLGVGCLSWSPEGHAAVRRHMLSVPVTVGFDADSGEVSVSVLTEAGVGGMSVELMEFLDSAKVCAPTGLREAERSARENDIDPLDRAAVGALVRRMVHSVDPAATYLDDMTAATATRTPVATYAPAVIVRPRGRRGLERLLGSIARRIRERRALPDGLRDLVDPDHVPAPVSDADDGAIVRDGTDCFLPLPLNDVQLRILDHVDNHAHTVVQGPPGTGKTHTAAALITHLLAQGKRVLVTAQTDRALEEVRGKLREEIRPLCVSVVGASRESFADLESAVRTISKMADDHDPKVSAARGEKARLRIADLRARRADVRQRLSRARELEVARHDVRGYRGTLSDIVVRHRAQARHHAWATDLLPARVDVPLPVDGAEVEQWRRLLLDETLRDPEVRAPALIRADELTSAHEMRGWFARRASAASRCRELEAAGRSSWAIGITELQPHVRAELRGLICEMDRVATEEESAREPWIRQAVADLRAGHAAQWHTRAEEIDALLRSAEGCAAEVGMTEVTVAGEDHGPLVALAEKLIAHLAENDAIKTNADGSPKIGFRTPRIVKEAAPLFERVRVDGRIPTTEAPLRIFCRAEEAIRLLHRLDAMWFGVLVPPPAAVTIGGRLAWHRDAHARIVRLTQFDGRLRAAGTTLREYGLAEPDWADARSVRWLLAAFDAVAAMDELRAADVPIEAVRSRLRGLRSDPGSTATIAAACAAIEHGDGDAYAAAVARLAVVDGARQRYGRLRALEARMSALPALRSAVEATPSDPKWAAHAAELSAAWDWVAVGGWLADESDAEVNDLFTALDDIESGLRAAATDLAVQKSWDRAVGPGGLTRTARADLQQYVQLVRMLGKGTGTHAARHRGNVQQALTRCRAAVPVWIMPIYRIVEQLDIEPDMFDVIVVDEASQAGLESVFLQYLAPRIVVIGDDKQVSPSGVGIEQVQLQRLASQYLFDFRFRASWENPKHSLFDEALLRFAGRLTLVEHRRCVPEIIGFSNMIAYEPHGVRLAPVRMFGSDRLPPIEAVYVADGVSRGDNVNEREAERLVERIVECVGDPAYAGKTFGVISLLGKKQAKLVWDKVLRRLAPEEIARRQLRCGDAADFQGAERDVIFLSMVKSSGPDSLLVAQTGEQVVQRYNVAVSRARDQLWLFHSVAIEELRNPEDLRFRLLDYCRTARQSGGARVTMPRRVAEDRPVAPFDSLFEQQVFNRVVDRGYLVTAHEDATGYDMDMVVVGGRSRVAVQCDGDTVEGPEQFQWEIARQRDLERCGWPFFRVRRSRFIADPESAMSPLWLMLGEHGIHPASAQAAPALEESAVASASPVVQDIARLPVEGVVRSPVEDVVRPSVEEIARPLVDDVGRSSVEDVARARVGDVARKPVEEIARSPVFDEDLSEEFADAAVEESAALPEPRVGRSTRDRGQRVGVSREEESAAVSVADVAVAPKVVPYESFSELAARPDEVADDTVVHDLVRIVGVEGPVCGGRVHAIYLRGRPAAEHDRLREAVDRALREAVRAAVLVDEDPLDLGDPERWTYRLPDQPHFLPRTLGARQISQVPARELADVMRNCGDRLGWTDRAALMRAVLSELGESDLTDEAVAELALVLPLATRPIPEPRPVS
ncbi:AAA domain-containing protein [Nocardia bovistercoris]|uniref:AAA family ATPase n=1 Tax=Nocardia bovistercoris TaxID=2785916 RepID=A0A931N652_9NOCA|nr:AAA domain-containing protein [Nocardia bovistercoris]MBH0779333.1 AAA family ATPase [Nocardia bovistercoris]